MALSKPFILVGAGLAAASAIEGIRELDRETPILMFGEERALPYDRPPLSKKLWSNQMKLEEIYVHPEAFYKEQGVDPHLGNRIVKVDRSERQVTTEDGKAFAYEKLLLATGGNPRKLSIPGGDLEGIFYFRTREDFASLHKQVSPGKSALVIGGGFIGSELAAALSLNQIRVTMLFPSDYLVQRVFPKGLGKALTETYAKRGIRILAEDEPERIEKSGDQNVTHTRGGETLSSDIVVVGIGITPATSLAAHSGLRISNGIEVDDYLQSNDPRIFAAGDCCEFNYAALGARTRVEHWDNAKVQGKQAGRNLAGAHERYEHLPFFYSDLFEFGYEAVGEVDSRLETFADWQIENRRGIIYYLRDGVIRGAMMCDVWEKVDWARDLIRRCERLPQSLGKTG